MEVKVFIEKSRSCCNCSHGCDNSAEEVFEAIVFYDYDLARLEQGQRVTITLAITVLSALAIFGNIGTLCVSHRRKLRPFFRACVISLAVSDLLTTLVTALTFLSQFWAEFMQEWLLGAIMCTLVSFIETTAILATSMTLVGIALDRYMAVMRALGGTCNCGRFFYGTFLFFIWGLSAGIASPLITLYEQYPAFIVKTDPKNPLLIVDTIEIEMCVSKKDDDAYYFVVVLSIVFVPALVGFIWLNAILAKKLWIRRRTIRSIRHTPRTQLNHRPAANVVVVAQSKRETRHIRMFCVVIILMAVFICFRLPAWIYLIMRLYGNYSRAAHWILYYVFGIFTLASCAVNPLLYTFLTETIQYFVNLHRKIRGICGRNRWRKRRQWLRESAASGVCCSGKRGAAAVTGVGINEVGNGATEAAATGNESNANIFTIYPSEV